MIKPDYLNGWTYHPEFSTADTSSLESTIHINDSAEAIADAIIYMKEHPEIIKQFEAAIELWYFKGDYSWKTIADDVYHDCYKIIANK